MLIVRVGKETHSLSRHRERHKQHIIHIPRLLTGLIAHRCCSTMPPMQGLQQSNWWHSTGITRCCVEMLKRQTEGTWLRRGSRRVQVLPTVGSMRGRTTFSLFTAAAVPHGAHSSAHRVIDGAYLPNTHSRTVICTPLVSYLHPHTVPTRR